MLRISRWRATCCRPYFCCETPFHPGRRGRRPLRYGMILYRSFIHRYLLRAGEKKGRRRVALLRLYDAPHILCGRHTRPFGAPPPQKHSRLARLKRFAILLVSSPHRLASSATGGASAVRPRSRRGPGVDKGSSWLEPVPERAMAEWSGFADEIFSYRIMCLCLYENCVCKGAGLYRFRRIFPISLNGIFLP